MASKERIEAIAWWSTLSLFERLRVCSSERNVWCLTGREIQEIFEKIIIKDIDDNTLLENTKNL